MAWNMVWKGLPRQAQFPSHLILPAPNFLRFSWWPLLRVY
ncbi:hypothetical protein ACJIZ3_014391 [Penstemon smallii]|uniref:Uncharacterized protein n=1 Tax=Penstemon smallii TaxID=265156 RepID=A0ABD3RJI0_9LAMI